MIIVDIKSIPEGMDLTVWGLILKEHKLCIYHSKDDTLPPIHIPEDGEKEGVVFIDKDNMSNSDLELLRKAHEAMTDDERIQSKEAREKMKARQRKLIDYLKNLNDEIEKDTDSKKDDNNNKESD